MWLGCKWNGGASDDAFPSKPDLMTRNAMSMRFKASDDSESGRSTVEFAIVMSALFMILVGLAALWRAGQDGRLVELMRINASHGIVLDSAWEAIQDVLLY